MEVYSNLLGKRITVFSHGMYRVIRHLDLVRLVTFTDGFSYQFEIERSDVDHSIVTCHMKYLMKDKAYQISQLGEAVTSSGSGANPLPATSASSRAFDRAAISLLDFKYDVYSDIELDLTVEDENTDSVKSEQDESTANAEHESDVLSALMDETEPGGVCQRDFGEDPFFLGLDVDALASEPMDTELFDEEPSAESEPLDEDDEDAFSEVTSAHPGMLFMSMMKDVSKGLDLPSSRKHTSSTMTKNEAKKEAEKKSEMANGAPIAKKEAENENLMPKRTDQLLFGPYLGMPIWQALEKDIFRSYIRELQALNAHYPDDRREEQLMYCYSQIAAAA